MAIDLARSTLISTAQAMVCMQALENCDDCVGDFCANGPERLSDLRFLNLAQPPTALASPLRAYPIPFGLVSWREFESRRRSS